MNRIEYLQTGGFPLDTNNLNFLQESFKIMQAFGYFAGDLVIISGCQQTGTTIANGVVFINGEVLEFRGGNVAENVIIREEAVSAVFEDGKLKPIEITRYATFGTSVKNYPWINFKRGFPTTEIPAMREKIEAALKAHTTQIEGLNKQISSLTQSMTSQISAINNQLTTIIQRLTNVENRKYFVPPVGIVLIWNKPSNTPLPNGWKECTDLRGRIPIGWDPDDQDFNEISKQGGEKAVTLTLDQIPPHTHRVPTFANGSASGNAVGHPDNWIDQNRLIESLSSGGGEAHNNMPPYRVIKYIEYIG